MATSEHIRPKEHCARRRQQRPHTCSARKVQRYYRIASILIPIAPAVRIPNLEHRQTNADQSDRPLDAPEKPLSIDKFMLLPKPSGRQHTTTDASQSNTSAINMVLSTSMQQPRGLRISCMPMGKAASSAQPIKRTPKPAAQSTFACSDTKTFPKSQHDANCNDRLARTDEAARTYRATVATRRVRGHNQSLHNKTGPDTFAPDPVPTL